MKKREKVESNMKSTIINYQKPKKTTKLQKKKEYELN